MRNKEKEILLKGGTILDPSRNIKKKGDVRILEGKIAEIGENLAGSGETIIVPAEGCYVTPGLVDMHCHIYPSFPFQKDGLPTIHPQSHMFQSGVTTAVDAGTCGSRDFIRFKEQIIDKSRLRILAFINIAAGGMVSLDSEQDIREFHPEIAAAMAKTFGDIVVGIKTAHYWVGRSFDREHPPWESVDRAVEAGNLCGKPVMADFQPNLPERTYQELLMERLRPGDIHTHVYAQQFPILDKEGNVNSFLFEAVKRGILFDLGHGAGSFWFRNAIPAYRQGFLPDVISTDLYLDNVAGPVINLLHVMSKYLSMGMPLEEVIYRTTKGPARIIGHEELGDLRPGAFGDVAVLRVEEGHFGYADSGHARMNGNKRLECVMTIRAGRIVYDPGGLGMPLWETAPEAYWTPPGVL
ncbi:hypothetical protein D3Z60_06010 [Lachnospiraceae bacterium]|nr:hypothetical protein [Lachnospiraceae bacterium]